MSPRKGLTAEDYRRMAREGYSQAEAARELGVTRQTVAKVAVKHGIKFPIGYVRKEKRDAIRAVEKQQEGTAG